MSYYTKIKALIPLAKNNKTVSILKYFRDTHLYKDSEENYNDGELPVPSHEFFNSVRWRYLFRNIKDSSFGSVIEQDDCYLLVINSGWCNATDSNYRPFCDWVSPYVKAAEGSIVGTINEEHEFSYKQPDLLVFKDGVLSIVYGVPIEDYEEYERHHQLQPFNEDVYNKINALCPENPDGRETSTNEEDDIILKLPLGKYLERLSLDIECMKRDIDYDYSIHDSRFN